MIQKISKIKRINWDTQPNSIDKRSEKLISVELGFDCVFTRLLVNLFWIVKLPWLNIR